jgi:hypothetical protein
MGVVYKAEDTKLQRSGSSYTAIARTLRISPQAAHKLVSAVFQLFTEELGETVPVVRQLELERLDQMLLGTQPTDTTGLIAGQQRG